MSFEFTAAELNYMLSTSMDVHMKSEITEQQQREKPLLDALEKSSKPFPGGKELLTWAVKLEWGSYMQGFSGDDVVDYSNPTNLKRAFTTWKELHGGIKITHSELKHNGIIVTDTVTGNRTKETADRGIFALENILEEKLADFSEGWMRDKNDMFWDDGSQDPKLVPGLRYWIHDDPTDAVVVGGIDQAANSLWRNRASLAIAANSGNASTNVLADKLSQEWRAFGKEGARPSMALAGSDFINQLEKELRAKGDYTNTGWAKNGGVLDVSIGDTAFKGQKFVYDPALDDMGRSKYMYWLTIGKDGLRLRHLDGDRDRPHAPARPENQYVMFRAMTSTYGLECKRRNSSGVYSIA
jgi:hypothetical protein